MKYTISSFRASLLVLAAAITLPACSASAATDSATATLKASGTLTIQGDCRTLTDANGHKFALVGDLGKLANGDQVQVTGKKAEKVSCYKGPAIRVEKIEKLATSAKQAGEPAGKPELVIVTDGSASPEAGSKGGMQVRMLHMRGTLTKEGKKCQGFRNLRGDLWVLTGDLKGFKTGDKVEIEGVGVDNSDCGQPTVQINSIKEVQE